MEIKELSVFFPLFNEEGNVRTSVEKAIKVLEKLKLKYEILLVNDGSKDNTAEIIDALAKENPKIRAIHHKENLGYGEALKSGFYNAKYDTIVYTDGDGQFDFSEVDKFLEKIGDYDLIIGYRIKRQDPFFRIIFKKGWALSLWLMYGLTLKDVDCGFKMVKRRLLEKIPHLESTRGAMINAELAIKAKKYGFKVAQVGVNHYPRLSGKPTGASLKVIIKSYLDLLKLWWELKDQKLFFFALIFILVLASFLRFYKLAEYMTFLGDEGRDMLVIKDLLVNLDIPLIGPPTSVGNIYLGPLYYYMMAVPLFIFYLNPAAAAGMVGVIGIMSVYLIYYLGKVWFGRLAGLIGAYLYAISPITIIQSRSSWNPNPASFFVLLSIFSLYKVNQTGNFLWLILTGTTVAAASQMHYLALILIPICITIYLYELFFRRLRKQPAKNLRSGTFLAVAAFLLVMSPLFWFDLRHDFLNYNAVVDLFTKTSAVGGNVSFNIIKLPPLYFNNLVGRHLTGENFYLTLIVSVLIIIPLVRALFLRFSSGKVIWPYWALGIWLIIGLLGLSYYQYEVYDHYLGFVNPAIFLLFGSLVTLAAKKENIKWIAGGGMVILLITLSIVNLQKNPLLYPASNQLWKTQQIAKYIVEKSNNKEFNFALLAKSNYDSAYQFYLEMLGYQPKQLPFVNTGQLFVVCEDEVCDPTHSPKYEIAAFGWSKIDWREDYLGVKIYRLIPNPSGKP